MKKVAFLFAVVLLVGLSVNYAFASTSVNIKYAQGDQLGSQRAEVVKNYVRQQGGHINSESSSTSVPSGNVYVENSEDTNTSANVPISDKLARGQKKICVPQKSIIDQVMCAPKPKAEAPPQQPGPSSPPVQSPRPRVAAPPERQPQVAVMPIPMPRMFSAYFNYCTKHRTMCHRNASCRRFHEVGRDRHGKRHGPPRSPREVHGDKRRPNPHEKEKQCDSNWRNPWGNRKNSQQGFRDSNPSGGGTSFRQGNKRGFSGGGGFPSNGGEFRQRGGSFQDGGNFHGGSRGGSPLGGNGGFRGGSPGGGGFHGGGRGGSPPGGNGGFHGGGRGGPPGSGGPHGR